MITTTKELEELVGQAKKTDAVALDTEFFWERTYYPKLGLIQIALSDEDCHLIDPLAINDLTPLGELLSDRGVVKILHDAPQDLAILYRATGAAPQNIFDTRLAAGFSSLPATLSLSNLIKELLDIDLPKTETRTDWLQRPLKETQIKYALDDVRYLRAVRILLLTRIIGPKIKSWLQEELNLLNNPKTYLNNNHTARYLKIRGVTGLNRQSLAILRALTVWREDTAKTQNKPRGHILKDSILLNIAKKKLDNSVNLKEKSEMSKKAFDRYSEQVTTVVETTLNAGEQTYPSLHRSTRLPARDKETLERLHNLIRLKCDLLGIDPSLVGNNNELKTLVKILNNSGTGSTQQLRQTDGWRKNFLEDFFQQQR